MCDSAADSVSRPRLPDHADPETAQRRAGSLQHDLRNDLAVLSGALHFLERKLASTDTARTDLRIPSLFRLAREAVVRASNRLDGTAQPTAEEEAAA